MTDTGTMSGASPEAPLFVRITLPEGLENMLESLSKEVLKHQPSQQEFYEFAANHFETLILQRQEKGKNWSVIKCQ